MTAKQICDFIGIDTTPQHLYEKNELEKTPTLYHKKLLLKYINNIKDEYYLQRACHQGMGMCKAWNNNGIYPHRRCFTCSNFNKDEYEKLLEEFNE